MQSTHDTASSPHDLNYVDSLYDLLESFGTEQENYHLLLDMYFHQHHVSLTNAMTLLATLIELHTNTLTTCQVCSDPLWHILDSHSLNSVHSMCLADPYEMILVNYISNYEVSVPQAI